jgi:hypothetical protein
MGTLFRSLSLTLLRRVRRNRGRVLGLVVGSAMLGAVLAPQPAVLAQGFGQPGLDVRITAGAVERLVGAQTLSVTLTNPSQQSLTNVQVVMRGPASPSAIQLVTEGPLSTENRVGVIDAQTGMWYHTIGQVSQNGSITFTVSWFAACAGRWPFAVRVNDRRTSVSLQFTGTSNVGCGPDEIASPTPVSFFDLPWPPSIVASTTVTGTTTLPGGTTTSSTSTTAVGVTIPTIPPTGPVGVETTTSTSTTRPATSTRPPTTRATTRVTSTRKRPTTSVEIVCKTVGGRRYCGPKSSALKPGQKKPRDVTPTTKKKKK